MNEIMYIKTKNFNEKSIGGAVGHTIGIANGFFKNTKNIEFLTDVKLNSIKSDQVVLKRGKLRGNYIFDLISNRVYYKNILSYLKSENPKFIYHRHVLFCDVGVRLKKKYNIPLIIEYNSSEIKKWTQSTTIMLPKSKVKRIGFSLMKLCVGLFYKNWEMNILTNANLVVVVSEILKDELISQGIDKRRVIVQPNGVDCDFFENNLSARKNVREKYKFSSEDTIIGFSGTFGNWHGIPELTAAIKSIAQRPNVGFLLIGEGAMKNNMENELSTFSNVVFAGKVAYNEMPNYLSACDIVVVANSWENKDIAFFGSPTKLFEYMSMGKAIVASNLGQIENILDHRENAILFNSGSSKALSNGILELIDNPLLRERIGVNAREKAENRFTWDIVSNNIFEKFYELEEDDETSIIK